MATPYKSNGNDFDDIFEPIGSETKAANVGYSIAGVDISNRYYPLSAGGSSPAPVGYSKAGTDLSQIFAAKGSVSYGFGFEPLYTTYNEGTTVVDVSAVISLYLSTDLSWTINDLAGLVNDEGTWAKNGVASDYEIRIIVNYANRSDVTSSWSFGSHSMGNVGSYPWTSPWYIMTEDRTFSANSFVPKETSIVSSITVNFTLEVREISNPSNIISGTTTFEATAANT